MNLMMSRLFHGLAAVLVVGALSLPFAEAQSDVSLERGVKVDPSGEQKSSGSSSPAFPVFVMILYTMLVLTIVCMPSRKA
jgi:hypothetical protein